MHMADALLSPAVGGIMWAATGTTIIYCSKKIKHSLDDRKIPLMGVMGAFIFAAQMINFAIPATGSSGHLGGGLLLAILLGPSAAFLTLASVLTVQALFFADGGLLALGCNIFNLGFAPCFIAYPLIYQRITRRRLTAGRLLLGTMAAALVGLQLGSLGVVIQTNISGMLSLSFSSFLLLMQAIHLPIGIIEGLVTAGVVSFLWRTRPEILDRTGADQDLAKLPLRNVLIGLGVAAILTGGLLSWFASENPDGLEWSLLKATDQPELHLPATAGKTRLEKLQEQTALLPDYGFRQENQTGTELAAAKTGTTVAGLVGGTIVLLFGLLLGTTLKKLGRHRGQQNR
ncbi:MAG: energy-coupling factor ABC transporter permease [Desulfobulbaceae bacterium]|nr:energy-coupling factor ABC transporter permease [Desulfobulbaceae bacterium]